MAGGGMSVGMCRERLRRATGRSAQKFDRLFLDLSKVLNAVNKNRYR